MAAIGVFQPARFEALYGVISAVVSASATQGAAGEWYMAVEREREALGSLGQIRGPSEAERREINAGKIVLDGATQSLNADFVAQTLLLADRSAAAATPPYALRRLHCLHGRRGLQPK